MNKDESLASICKTGSIEAGCDEAGRGCLAGPVVAAAVIFPEAYSNPLINDSKKLTEKKRQALKEIIHRDALDYCVAMVETETIEEINILNSSILAMHKALDGLKKLDFNHIIVDGNKFKPYKEIEYQTVVKGDSKFLSIAAASILAKTARDEHIDKLAELHPEYQWHKNKAYGTKAHREALLKYGATPHHRPSFLKKILTN